MSTVLERDTTEIPAKERRKMVHVFCYGCGPDKGLCGASLCGKDLLPFSMEFDCVVCAEIVAEDTHWCAP